MCFCGLMGAVMTEIKYSCSSSQRRSCLLFCACTLKSDLVLLLKYLVCVVLIASICLLVLWLQPEIQLIFLLCLDKLRLSHQNAFSKTLFSSAKTACARSRGPVCPLLSTTNKDSLKTLLNAPQSLSKRFS